MILEKMLDFSALRQRCIASNLANAETPGYKRFETVMEETENSLSLTRTHPAHLAGDGDAGMRVTRDATTAWRVDGNNVDPDAELVKMAENALYYQVLLKAESGKLAISRLVATEGRK